MTEWFIHGAAIIYLALLVGALPRRLLGTPQLRARGYLALAAFLLVYAPVAWRQDRPGAAVACVALAAIAVRVARVLHECRPVGAIRVKRGDPVEADDGTCGRVVDVGPWDFAVHVEDVMGQCRQYRADQVHKINGG